MGAIIKAVGITLLLMGGGLWLTWHWGIAPVITPTYKVGQCIMATYDREPWDAEQVWKIEMVGKRSYLVRRMPVNLYRPTPGSVLSFFTVYEEYKQVDCPPKS